MTTEVVGSRSYDTAVGSIPSWPHISSIAIPSSPYVDDVHVPSERWTSVLPDPIVVDQIAEVEYEWTVPPREPIDLTNAAPVTIVGVLEKDVRFGDGVQ
jgi:hypothetical protein